jgi:hypothetical protein
MKLRRPPKPTVEPQFASLIVELWFAYEEGMERCHEVAARDGEIDDELRARALASACRIAYVSRVVCEAIMHLDLANRVPAEHQPVRALAASARLAYSLTATAEAKPEPETILTIGDLDGLPVQYGLREWLDSLRSSHGDKG